MHFRSCGPLLEKLGHSSPETHFVGPSDIQPTALLIVSFKFIYTIPLIVLHKLFN
jgi:hypothetical protein